MNKDAIGARAEVHDRRSAACRAKCRPASSFISQNDARLHFGLAASETYDRIEVTWPGGTRESFPGGKADRVVTLTQGGGARLP